MTDEERLERIAIKTFKQHWAKILKNLEKGEINYVDKLCGRFEADTKARQKILAGRFYGLDHAKKMASLSEKEIKENLSCYLPRAIEYALSEPLLLEDEPKVFLKKLVYGEYVIFYDLSTKDDSCFWEHYAEDSLDFWSVIEGYPTSDMDDDWYDKSIGRGFFHYYIFVLMKSTGETFSNTEMTWLRKSIQKNIDDKNESNALWWFVCKTIDKNKLWIKIYEFPNKEDYIDGFLGEEGYHLSYNQFKEFVCQMLEYLSKEKKWIKKLSAFNNYKSMKKKELFDLTDTFFAKYSKELGNFEIRAIEDIMNDITGRKERDYQAELYWF